MDRLIGQVVKGELTRNDLRSAARAKRASGAAEGSMAKSRHDRVDAAQRTETDLKVTAADIVMALRRSTWLPVRREDSHFPHVYQCFTEFRADTGTSCHTKRIDALIAETLTESDRDYVTLREIEIKVDLHNLEADHKMAEYTDFVDYFYLAIPADRDDMMAAAKSMIRPDWGIITVSKSGVLQVIKEAA